MVYGFVRNWFRVLVFRGCSEIGFGFMGFYELGNNSHPLSLAHRHCSQKSNSSFCHRTFGLKRNRHIDGLQCHDSFISCCVKRIFTTVCLAGVGTCSKLVFPFDQKQPHFPIRIMMKFPFPVNCFFLTIIEDAVYHLVPPPNINSDDSASTSSTRGWVVRLREGESGEPSMLHPLSSSFHIKRLPKSVFAKLLNLLEFRVFELAKTYTMYHSDHSVSSYRVAISLSPDWPAIMVVAAGKLYHCKLGPDIEMCTMVDTSEVFEDVICFEGKFYAVCYNSTAVVVDPSLEMTLIASPISPDHGSSVHCIKNLVESLGEILLVERYLSRIKHRFVPVKFRVYNS